MTDYPTKNSGWKKRQVQAKFSNLIAIFITAVLVFAIANGLLAGISIEKSLGKSTWSKGAPLIVAVNSSPASMLVYSADPEQLVLLKFDENQYFATGDAHLPVAKIVDLFATTDVSGKLSGAIHLPVSHYLLFDNRPGATLEIYQKYFKNFAAITTPVEILLNFPKEDQVLTNLTRIDLFRLWWGLKSYRLENLILADFSSLGGEEILVGSQKVETFDWQTTTKSLSGYLENKEVLREGYQIAVRNSSGVAGAGQLASDLIYSVGGRVVKVEADSTVLAKTQILAREDDSQTVSYLANMLGCDIKSALDLANDEIEVVVGSDFVQKYF